MANEIELIQAQWIDIDLIDYNEGQIEGLPANPRTIDPIDFANLKQSIEDDPEMLGMRELLVYPLGGRFVAIGGNMRLKALREMRYNAAPCKVLAQDTPQGKLRAIAIKDNVQKGEWDNAMLANDWSAEELQEWGVELPKFKDETEKEHKDISGEVQSLFQIVIDCDDEWEQERIYNELSKNYKCRVLTL